MLDIIQFIEEKGGNPEQIRKSQAARGDSVELVDEIINGYKEWTKIRFDLDALNKEQNKVQKAIGAKFKAKEDASELIKEKDAIAAKKAELTIKEQEADQAVRNKVNLVGNIVHESVVVSNDEENNEIVRKWNPEGKEVDETKKAALSHHEVLTRLDGYDPERGTKISGHRGYFLRNWGVFLNQAMINYGLDFLAKREYIPLQAPVMMNKEVMAKTAQLSQFDEELYKVIDGNDEKYLIATSEQPISAYHSGEWFEQPAEQLPKRYAGYSTCFRREAGSYGAHVRGLNRLHQFDKVEIVQVSHPNNSYKALEEMVSHVEEIVISLELPYRILRLCGGDMGFTSALTYDFEVFSAAQQRWLEVSSVSNFESFQANRLKLRYRDEEGKIEIAHTLNGSALALPRIVAAILENNQQEDKIRVPKVLVPYTRFEYIE